jgi:hypothetical protein
LALAGLIARQVREGRPGFSTGLLPWRKGIDIPVDPPAGLVVQPSPPHRGPTGQSRGLEPLRGSSLFCKSAPCARPTYTAGTTYLRGRAQGALLQGCVCSSAFLAPYGAAGGWRKSPQGGSRGCEPVWRQGMDAPSSNLRNPHAHLEGVSPQGAPSGWPFSWLLLFTPGILPSALRAGFAVRARSRACVATQREVTRAAAAARKPAAGEPGRDTTTIERTVADSLPTKGRRPKAPP